MSNGLKFAIVAVVVNLHTLRNLSFATYIAIYAVVSGVLVADFLIRMAKDERRLGWGPFVAWLAASLLGALISLGTISASGALTGLSRFLFAMPIFMALYLYTDDLEQLRGHVKTLVVFFALASLTLPMQIVTGPISWFAGATERGGLERYASLVGSLTSIGVVVGSYLLLTHALTPRSRPWWMILIAVSAAMSLSKAAIANVAIAFGVLLVMNRRHLSRIVFGLGLVAVLGLAIYSLSTVVQDRVDAVLVSFGIQNSAIENFDVSAEESVMDRLLTLPAANLEVLKTFGTPLIYVFGAGFGMANTALVPEEDSLAQMAHNQYVEVFSVFGIVGAALIFGAMLTMLVRLVRLHRRIRSDVTSAVLWAYVLILVNSVTANGTLYQPAAASILYLGMYCAVAEGLFVRAADARSGLSGLDRKNNATIR